MNAVPRVVLVGHDASATGVPRCALAWTRWAARTGAAEVEVRLDRGGPLAEAFAAVAPTTIRSRAAREATIAADALLGLAAARRVRSATSLRTAADPEVTVIAASIAAWRSAAVLARRARLVLWLHELDGVADRVVAPAERAALLDATDRIVAVGSRVAAMVVERWGVAPDRVTTVDSFVDPLAAHAPAATAASEDAPPGALPYEVPQGRGSALDLVAVGSMVHRKGPDLFVALTALLHRDRPALRAAWVGGPLDSPCADLVRYDLTAAGLGDVLTLAGEVADVGPWWPADGVLVHLAREDPSPLVVLEAGQRAIPVVTWDTGGAADLLRTAGLGRLVAEPGDLVAAADAVATLLDDDAERERAGAALRAAVASRTTDHLGPALLAACREVGP